MEPVAPFGLEWPTGGLPVIAVVIPCYRVRKQILGVLSAIGPECDSIYVIDDGCPEQSGAVVEAECHDPRVRVIHHDRNQGVGAATLTGYRAAIEDGADVIVRLDGDGQMDPALIPRLVQPIIDGEADYTKGNRFFDLEGIRSMPKIRLVGNSLLSFATKLSSGYWDSFDPNNGFTAIHAAVIRQIPMEKLSRGWFFESDILFRLGIMRAVVRDVPMRARYGDESSSLVVRRVIGEFALKHLLNTAKRILYNYYIRNFNIASIEIVLGLILVVGGTWFGAAQWAAGNEAGVPSTSGPVMLAALPVLIGVQFVLAFLNYDLQNIPNHVIHKRLLSSS
jgi:glycosyltransferase involved in cell wall biosynthesis